MKKDYYLILSGCWGLIHQLVWDDLTMNYKGWESGHSGLSGQGDNGAVVAGDPGPSSLFWRTVRTVSAMTLGSILGNRPLRMVIKSPLTFSIVDEDGGGDNESKGFLRRSLNDEGCPKRRLWSISTSCPCSVKNFLIELFSFVLACSNVFTLSHGRWCSRQRLQSPVLSDLVHFSVKKLLLGTNRFLESSTLTAWYTAITSDFRSLVSVYLMVFGFS